MPNWHRLLPFLLHCSTTAQRPLSPVEVTRRSHQVPSCCMDLETTVAELAKPLLRYCLAGTGELHTAEDLAQQSLTALVQRWRRSGPPDSPAAFVFTIARRRVAASRLRRSLLLPLDLVSEPESTEPTEEERLIDRSLLRSIRREMNLLPRAEREAMSLVFAAGLEYADAAAALGISTATLRMRLHRARKRLRGQLEDRYDTSTI